MFTKEVEDAARAHALAEFPKEAVGLVIDGQYVPQENIAEDPEADFYIEGFPLVGLEAVIHSHPKRTVAAPSALDMQSQIETAVPWGIIATDGKWASKVVWFGDQVPLQPLLGRQFLHGITDCYEGLRSFFKMTKGVWLLQFPRDEEWWNDPDGPDLLTPENFKKAGFTEISYNELQPGDVVLAAILCKRVNHCGVYVGNGLVMHHLYNRMSKREPLGPWLKFCRYYLRYVG